MSVEDETTAERVIIWKGGELYQIMSLPAPYRRNSMNGFTAAITPGISASMPVLADILVAVLLSWIDVTLYRTSQNAATHKADAMLLELGFGLLTVVVMVLWFGLVLEIFF